MMKRRPGTIAGPRSRSSMVLGLDSSRTLLILVFHGVKRETRAPLPGLATHWQTLDRPESEPIDECVQSAGTRVVCDARGRAHKQEARSKKQERPFGRIPFSRPSVKLAQCLPAIGSAQPRL